MGKRKLQIFLSSTYEDLIPYRFAAMQAILKAGHIPAGMEQFSPGEATAWEMIRSWIDESDAFILILGGRYGSIEPLSGKSYIQLEYEYAVERKKPFCSLVIKEAYHEQRMKELGFAVDERAHAEKYREFKRTVTERLCEFWSDEKEVQLAVFWKLSEWEKKKPELVGWVRSDELPAPDVNVMNELARLSLENHDLQLKLATLSENYDGLSFDDLVRALREAQFDAPPDAKDFRAALEFCEERRVKQIVSEVIEAKPSNAGELFDGLHEAFSGTGLSVPIGNRVPYQRMEGVLHSLFSHGLMTAVRAQPSFTYEEGTITYTLTDLGRRFRNRVLAVGDRDERRTLLWSTESSADVRQAGSA